MQDKNHKTIYLKDYTPPPYLVTTVALRFELDDFRKHCLLEGLDEIGLTMQSADKIRAFEVGHRERQPWMFDAVH